MDEIDTYKILMLGDSLVGKTSILHRYTEYMFSRITTTTTTTTTIDPSFKIRKIRIDNNHQVKLQIWDSSSRFIPSYYYRDVNGFILVFDVTNNNSMDNIKDVWLKEIEKYNNSNNSNHNNIVLLANKIDLLNNSNNSSISNNNNSNSNSGSRVTFNQMKELSASTNIPLYNVSAKDNTGIEEAFHQLSTNIFNHINTHNNNNNNNTNNNTHNNQYCVIL